LVGVGLQREHVQVRRENGGKKQSIKKKIGGGTLLKERELEVGLAETKKFQVEGKKTKL